MASKKFILCAAAAVVFCAGCSRHPAPPFERTELVLRFFRSIRNGDFAAAVKQGDKIRQLDRHNSPVIRLIAIHEGNGYIRRAQKALNKGDISAAAGILNAGRRQYPANQTLIMLGSKVRQLRNAEKLIGNMKKAGSSAAMASALSAASIGLSANITPKLRAYLHFYENEIKRVRIREAEERKKESMLKDAGAKSADPGAAPAPAGEKKQ